jgi:serine/threonine protein kinase
MDDPGRPRPEDGRPGATTGGEEETLMEPMTERAGSVIGRYKILEEIGQGGFGLVYLAEQREPVRRNVALKIIKLGMDTRQVIARFEAERQALAMMDHPHIAKVLDAGTTERGSPYFVMELVHGEPITHYCDKHNVVTRERLALFMQVCNAIQHAHQKGVIHRDIKPSNILVTLQDGKPIPKVIDFGLAKALHTRLTEETVFTQRGQLVGTPEYMSPEQAEMSGLDVDTRSDIYSLGAVLYELLTGALPYDPESLRAKGLSEIHRIIREVDPVKPSTRLSSLGDKTDEIARSRAAEIASLQRQVRGDLDWIVLKAMAKDRTRRYETANGLGLDIQRHLDDEPVLARRPSTRYRLSKFVRRNRVGVVSGAAIAVGLVLSTVIAVMGLVSALDAANEARRERDAARAARVAEAQQRERAEVAEQDAKQEASRARAVSEFLQDVLAAPSPYREGRDVRVEDLLELASSSASDALAGQPEEEASIRRTLGRTYQSLGLLVEADIEYQRAIDLFGRAGDEFWRDRARCLIHRVEILGEQQRWDELLELAEPLYEKVKTLDPPDAELFEAAVYGLADALRRSERDPSRAAELLRDVVDSRVERLGESDPATMRALASLGMCLVLLDEFAEGTALLRKVLSYRHRVLGEDHPTTLQTMDQLGWALLKKQDYSAAELLLREGRDRHRRVWGPDHPLTLQMELNLAWALKELEQWEDVLAVARPALASQRRQFGDEHSRTQALARYVATALTELGRTAELGD